MTVIGFYEGSAAFCSGAHLFFVVMQLLNEFERFAGDNGVSPCGFFAGGEIGFKRGVKAGEAAAQDGGEIGCVHLLAAQTAEAETAAAEALKGDGDGGRGCSGVAVEGAERV